MAIRSVIDTNIWVSSLLNPFGFPARLRKSFEERDFNLVMSELFKGNNSVKRKASEYVSEYNNLSISHMTKYEILKGLKAKNANKQIDAFLVFCNKY